MHLNLCFKSPQIIQPSNIFTKLGTLGFRVYRVIIRSKCHRLKTLLKKKSWLQHTSFSVVLSSLFMSSLSSFPI